ncbi:mucin-13 isoform 2-T2 [Liasis olivaceus]
MQTSQYMTDYLEKNTDPPTVKCPDQISAYGAKCVQLLNNTIFQCPYGFYYESACKLGQVFPGQVILHYPLDVSMEDTVSENYTKLYENLTNFFNQIFGETSFKNISIFSVKSSSATSQRLSKAEDKNETIVTLITMFDQMKNMTRKMLEETVKNSTVESIFNTSSFKYIPACDLDICDKNTTNCTEVDGGIPKCNCKTGLAKLNQEDTACQACDGDCSAANNKFCLMKADHVPECQCLPNFEKSDKECQACTIGFSGEDCQDSYMAILIGISTLCAVLLVALIGVIIYLSVRKKGRKAENQHLISNEYSTIGNTSGIPPATNPAGNEKIFPKVQAVNDTPSSRTTANNPTNFHEGGAANRGYLPERDYGNDNWLEMPSRGRF